MILTGWSIPIGVVIVVLVTLAIRKISSDSKSNNTCTTCGLSPSPSNEMIRCSKCNQLICLNGLEELVKANNYTTATIEVMPSPKDPSFPCGTRVIITEINKPQTVACFCKKHTPRIAYHHKIIPVP